eukprot:EG_transcript_37673
MSRRAEVLALYRQLLKLERGWPKTPEEFKGKQDTREELGDLYYSRVQLAFRDNKDQHDPAAVDRLIAFGHRELAAGHRLFADEAEQALPLQRSYVRGDGRDSSVVKDFAYFVWKRLRGL